jgi:hypothetical protein
MGRRRENHRMGWRPGKRALSFFVCVVMGLPVISLIIAMPAGFAEPPSSKIMGISASPQGDLVLRVEGEGFDPILRLEPISPTRQTPAGTYRIVVQGLGVKLDSQSAGSLSRLSLDLVDRLPAIEKVQWTESTTRQPSFQLSLISCRKLQPQVLSNSGQEIVISLLGDHSAPPAVLAHRRVLVQLEQEAREKKAKQLELAEQRRQAEVKRQEEARMRAEEERIIRMQQQADNARLSELRQQQMQNMAALRATLRSHHLHGEPMPQSSQIQARELQSSQIKSKEFQSREIQPRVLPASHSDWQNAYVAPSVKSKPESSSMESALPKIQTTAVPPTQSAGAADVEFAPLINYEAVPTGPLHLKKPPADFAAEPDESLIGPPRPR